MCNNVTVQCLKSIIQQSGPILAMKGEHAISFGKDEFHIWDISETMPILVESQPHNGRGRFRDDVCCLVGDAENKLNEYVKREEEV